MADHPISALGPRGRNGRRRALRLFQLAGVAAAVALAVTAGLLFQEARPARTDNVAGSPVREFRANVGTGEDAGMLPARALAGEFRVLDSAPVVP